MKKVVHHIDGNPWNNHSSNLRVVDAAANRTPGPFSHRFDQLAVYETGRTPVLLLEAEYNRAQLCWNMHDEMVELLRELIDIEGLQPGTAEWADKARATISKATQGAT